MVLHLPRIQLAVDQPGMTITKSQGRAQSPPASGGSVSLTSLSVNSNPKGKTLVRAALQPEDSVIVFTLWT